MFSQLPLDCIGIWNSMSKDFKINVVVGAFWRTAEISLQLPFCLLLSQCFSNQVFIFMLAD